MIVAQPRDLLFAWLSVRTHIGATDDFRAIGWVSDGLHLRAVVGYNGFAGRAAQMHFATDDPAAITRRFVRAAFEYPFVQLGLEYLLAPVNSTNQKILTFTRKIGFREVHRLPGCHEDGGDLILLQMNRSECRWIKQHDEPSTMARSEAKRGG